MYRPTIGIDFGSAYTKVAYRQKFPQQKKGIFVERGSEILSFGPITHPTTLIPSIVIDTGSRTKPWLCGTEAAGTNPGKGWKVFSNWKSEIFSSNFRRRKNRIAKVANAFFTWLLREIKSTQPFVEIGPDTRIRFSIPALGNTSEQEDFLRNCMVESGWPGDIEFFHEPVANAFGTFSGGKNYITADGHMSYTSMFGQHPISKMNIVIDQIKRYLVKKTRNARYLKVAIIDCGGFTLDVAMLRLDLKVTEHSELQYEVLSSRSNDIGVVEQIDEVALTRLFKNHRVSNKTISFESLELAKIDLYSGKPHNMIVDEHILNLGESKRDKQIIFGALDNYNKRVWKDLSDLDWKEVEYVILTGGGLNIEHVRKFLESKLNAIGISNVIHFPENDELNPASSREESEFSATDYDDPFGRITTALGDTSIAFGFDFHQ